MNEMAGLFKINGVFTCSGIQLQDAAVKRQVTPDVLPDAVSFIKNDGVVAIQVVEGRGLPVKSIGCGLFIMIPFAQDLCISIR